MSFFLALGQVGFLKHGYLFTLHEFFGGHTIKSKKIHVEYAGSGKYVNTFDLTCKSQLKDLIPHGHLAFHGHNGPEIHNLSSLQDQDTITTRKQVFCGKLSHTLEEHIYGVNSVAWNCQGTKLASGSTDGQIKIWDSNTQKCIQTLEGHPDYVCSVAWNSQGLLASGSYDHQIKIWDTKTWKCLQTLKEHTRYILSVAWNSQGTKLASGSSDRTIKIWDSKDFKTWKCVQTLEEHTGSVYSVAWNSQGMLASGSYDQDLGFQ